MVVDKNFSDYHSIMNETPSVSVLMINKNHGHYLEKTIQSYLNQSYSNIEIIVMDGGSTDNSIQIMEKYKSVKVHSTNDKSGGEAFANCLKYSTSNLVMFATSNDILVGSEFISQAVNFLSRNEEYACVFGNVVNLDPDNKIGGLVHPYNKKGYFNDYNKNFRRWLIDYESFHELAAIFRRESVLRTVGDLESYSKPISELEVDMFLELRFGFYSNGFKAKYLDFKVIAVRNHADRVSVESRTHFTRHLKKYIEQVENFRIDFLKRNYYFVSPSNHVIEPLGVFRHLHMGLIVIAQLVLIRLKKMIKFLIRYDKN